jgi:outer membrane receptor protein involved in Fe transport
MAEALIDFAVQAELSISTSGVDFRGALSNPVDGTFSKEEGLRRLLAGSSFDFDLVDSHTVRIRVATAVRLPEPVISAPEHIVVTATKREERADALPYSIVVVGDDQLETFGARSARALTSHVAGLNATNLGPGQDKLFVRGLTDSVLPGFTDSMVGMYLDEARIADNATAPDLRLIDVERVEVLRGPQGSLYGAGSLAGLVRIVTRPPVYDTVQAIANSTVSATEGGGMSASAEVMLNLPLVRDELAVRAVGYADTIGGYVDDTRLGISDANRTTVHGARLAVGWQPASDLSIVGNLAIQHIKAADSQYYLDDLGPMRRDNFVREPHADQIVQVGVTANLELGWAAIVSNTSFLDRRVETRFDASRAWPGLTGLPLGPSPFDVRRKTLSFAHETRLASSGAGRLKWLVGLFVSHRDEDFRSSLVGPNAVGDVVSARSEAREDDVDEASIFGEVGYDVTPSLTVTAGARLFRAARSVTAVSKGLLVGAPDEFKDSTSQQGAMPKLTVSYTPNDDLTLYAQFSQGYRLGGLNVNGPPDAPGEFDPDFDSDTLRNYEIGAKMRFFDARLVANVAGYFVLWKNVQTDLIGEDGSFFILNAGTVHSYGVEADVAVRPIPDLSVQGHLVWNNPDVSHSSPLLLSSDGVLPGAPRVSVGLSARYDVPIDETDTAFASVDYSYVGESHLGFNEETSQMGDYHLANIRIGVERANWRVVLFVDNIANSRGNTFAFGNPFSANVGTQVTPPRPRTAGVSLTWAQ